MDLNNETLLPLSQVARLIPGRRQGKPVHLATLYRWALDGLCGVRLETVPVGGGVYTSLAAVRRFSEAVRALKRREKVRLRTPAQRKRGHARAMMELEKAGY